ncbi:hypothetical protein DL96DRAFT_1709426 [Flagelloscypha sp. PMI_526]|nr:hypothetical protein DL96DRAFT_1709426 [Flagelloscypha sp. PMI_526]
MKMPRKFESLRSKMRKPASPLHESTNLPVVILTKDVSSPDGSPSKRKRCPSSSEPPRTRQRTDSNATILPATPKAQRLQQTVQEPRPQRSPTKKIQFLELPNIPDEEDFHLTPVGRLHSPPPYPYSMGSRSPSSASDDESIVSESSLIFAPHLRKPSMMGYTGLIRSRQFNNSIMSLLDIQYATPYPSVWDFGATGPQDSLLITLQLRFRSLDLIGYHRNPPQELYLRVASMTPPRFTVPDSIRAYESIYIRSHTHPGRAQGDSKNIFKTKGWRFKDEAWIYDVGWKDYTVYVHPKSWCT